MFHPFKQKYFRKKKGESIVEVVAAITISVMVLTATFLILQTALATNANVRNRVIAMNIAREGLEAVRNIRDTNWLKYSGDRRGKWLCLDTPGNDICAPSAAGTLLTSGNYIIQYDTTNNRYYLSEPSEQADLDLSTATDFSEYQLYKDSSDDYFVHTSTGNQSTIFYRQINLIVYDGTSDNTLGTTPCTTVPQCQENKIEVISRVQWLEEGNLRGSTIEHHLYDFLEREAYLN